MKQYREILEEIANKPEGPSRKEVPAPTPETMGRPIHLSANNNTDYPRTSTVQQLFEEVAATYPERIALQMRDWSLSYQTLNRLANRLAVQIRDAGVTANQPVSRGIGSLFRIHYFRARSHEGGRSLPSCRPLLPRRTHFPACWAKTNAPVLLTRSNYQEQVSSFSGKVIAVDQVLNDENANDSGISNLPLKNGPADLAYLMFTSGSTGNAKGVEVPHRGIVRLVRNTNYAQLDDSQVYLLASSLSFDASTFEIWAPLLNGGKLVLLPPGPPSLDTIASHIRKLRHHDPLAHFGALPTDGRRETSKPSRPLKQLLAGGDVLSKHHVSKVLTQLPELQLINGYGPTENTTFACCHPITSADLESASIPIGKPISNTDVYLLDQDFNPLPPMTEGELLPRRRRTGSRFTIRTKRSTAERFIDNPFSSENDSKLYRTGDRARYRPDGVIEFLGRTDNEVKIRGFRIDPAEIEEALCRHNEVTQARVVAQGDTAEQKNSRRLPHLTQLRPYRGRPQVLPAIILARTPDSFSHSSR